MLHPPRQRQRPKKTGILSAVPCGRRREGMERRTSDYCPGRRRRGASCACVLRTTFARGNFAQDDRLARCAASRLNELKSGIFLELGFWNLEFSTPQAPELSCAVSHIAAVSTRTDHSTPGHRPEKPMKAKAPSTALLFLFAILATARAITFDEGREDNFTPAQIANPLSPSPSRPSFLISLRGLSRFSNGIRIVSIQLRDRRTR